MLRERRKELRDYSQEAVGFLERLTVDLAGIFVLNSTELLVEGYTCLISVSEVQVQSLETYTNLWIPQLSHLLEIKISEHE